MNKQQNELTRVSVIIPCFNAATTIVQQLDALVNQSVMPWEVIVADNGSTDDSREIVSQYGERLPRLQIVDASDCRGAAHARNQGAAAAKGDFLAFCDADDVVSIQWLEALTEAFIQHRFVASRFETKLLNNGIPLNSPQEQGLQNLREPFLPFSGGCGIGIQRSLHEAVGGFDRSILYLEDMDYCFRVQLQGESLIFVPDAVIHIRYSSNPNHTFLSARQASFQHGYNWGSGLATVYKRYKEKGMRLHGAVPRIAISVPLTILCILSGLSCTLVWKLGWHSGVIRGLLSKPEDAVAAN